MRGSFDSFRPTRLPRLPFAMRLLFAMLWFVLFPASVDADASLEQTRDRILLHEIIPALEGAPLGRVEVASAPPPGHSVVVRRSQVLAALKEGGHSVRGLSIPRRTVVERGAQELDRDTIRARARVAVAQALAPCTVDDVRVPGAVTLPQGRVQVAADMRRPRGSGVATSGMLRLRVGGVERRLPVRARLSCPPPAVVPGARVRVVAVVGNVKAAVSGEAQQPGRVGDVIRVRSHTGIALRARVVDGRTVEVIQ